MALAKTKLKVKIMVKKIANHQEQGPKVSVQATDPAAADLQKKKPSNKTEGSLQPTAEDKKPSSET